MNKVSKVLVTAVAVVIFIALFALTVGVRGESGHSTPGVFGLILLAGLIGALRAIWKNGGDNKDKNKDSNNSILQK